LCRTGRVKRREMPRIFISYRRNDSLESTGRIYDRLVQRFGCDSVFRDIDSIPLGLPFPSVLRDTLARTDVVLAVIGPSWLSATLGDGRRRIDDPDDFVRLEIDTTLKNGLPLIPVTVGNACLPKPPELPDAIRGLVLQNGVAVRPDPDFHHDMDRLISRLERVLGEKAPVRRQIDKEVTKLQLEKELLQTDQQWFAEREDHMLSSQSGSFYPNWWTVGCSTVAVIAAGGIISVGWSTIHPLLGLVPAILCVGTVIYLWFKAASYHRAKKSYQQRRRELVRKIESMGDPCSNRAVHTASSSPNIKSRRE
jgi:hypothetical protein